MTYFSNGIEHQAYVETLCLRCVHWTDTNDGRGPGCPIMDLHFFWNHDALEDDDKRMALSLFIPPDPESPDHNGDCVMFLDRTTLLADQGDTQEAS